ncbi:RasGAP protein [Savitreella phatthalungensis]
MYSMVAAHEDDDVEDELARAQRRLRKLKANISSQSKKNFVLERDVRYLDSRIALLIQNRMALDESDFGRDFDDDGEPANAHFPDDRRLQQYGNLFCLLQSEPKHIANLTRLVSLSEIDSLLQTVMFTIYGNQYESREENLLLTMFQTVLSAQFESSTEHTNLLRANTPVSRMMTTYTRRGPGQQYLKSVLSERIHALLDQADLNLEINPLKVYEQLIDQLTLENGQEPAHMPRAVSLETITNNREVIAIMSPRYVMLVELANAFLETILASIDDIPYGIRWICKQIRNLTRRKFPEANICSLIGAFFFLRFINPAIVSPSGYMLVDAVPGDNPRRTLTLIAKLLQNLVNKPTHHKEAYIAPFQPFIEANSERIDRFLMDICEVPDFFEALEMDQYVALSKKDLILDITLNEVFTMHHLLERHIDTLAPDAKSHLRIIIKELGFAPPQVLRSENKAIELPLFSRWETPINEISQSLDLTPQDILFMESKSTFVQILRSRPEPPPLDLERVADSAAKSKDAALVRRGLKALEQLRELIDAGQDLVLLRDEISQELAYLGSVRDKAVVETESLQAVFKTICDHNDYLKGQLDTYRAYLLNVRGQAGTKASERGIGVVAVGGKQKKQGKLVLGPHRFTHAQLERDGVIVETNVPESRRQNIFFNISSPSPGAFVISLHYKGRTRGLLELDLKLDDLLEMQQNSVQLLDLEYVHFHVGRTLQMLNKIFQR